ncbi:MAG: hypothetical protein ABSH11_07265 [Verrucomicrobiota bacterium]|jgi:hypothetical protein
MIGLILIYLMCLISGAGVESRFSVNDPLERILVVFTLAAGQLLIAIQCLSLVMRLSGPWLILANVLLTALFIRGALLWPPADDRIPWRTLLTGTWREFAAQKREPLVLLLLAVALVSIVVHCSLGALMIPLGDSYHYEMPLFWIQNRSIAPFPVNNPRINTISFLGEALALPGFMYLHTSAMFVVITFVAGVLCVGVVFSLARKMGCGLGASACAAAITLGFPNFALTFLDVVAGSYLLGIWTGASLLFLIGSRPSESMTKQQLTRLGCSVFCFLMACGAKNTIPLLAPLYLIGLVATLRRFLFKRQVILVLVLCGAIASLCSGVLWNYINNKLWYGDFRGPESMQGHLSGDLGFRAVWTRQCRGAVLIAFDTIWIPQSARETYATVCETAVEALGGQKKIAEDDEKFSNFSAKNRKPLKGCGWVGLAFLFPGMVIAIGRCLRIRRFMRNGTESTRLGTCLLLLFVVGCFAISHAVLRWQQIGLLRLIPAFSILAAPLCALVLEKKWTRVVALGVLLLSTMMFLTYDLSMVGRRFGATAQKSLIQRILRLGREHGMTVEYQWNAQPPQTFFTQEDYSPGKICEKFLEGIAQPTVIGFAGGVTSDVSWFFGPGYRNKIICLVDDRKPDQLLEPPNDVEYLVFAENRSGTDEWASQRGFHPVFRAASDNGFWLVAFKRNAVENPR